MTIRPRESPGRLRVLRRMGVLGAACVAASLAACEDKVIEAAPVVRPVKVHTIGKADEQSRREYPGSIRAFQHANMGFEVGGRIEEFYVREGDEVVQGEVLARLDDRNYVADLEASKANLRKAEADLRRSQGIFKEDPGAISKQTIDADQRAVDVAKANLAVAQKAFDDTRLRAPFSGLMARKLVEDFQNVQAKEPVLILQDTSTLEIAINVPERDVARGSTEKAVDSITARSNPEVIVSALPHRTFPAKLKEFASAADPVTRTFSVKFNFENPGDVNILPGMTARVQVTVDPERAWTIPVSAAVADDSGKPFVWKLDTDSMRVSPTPVTLGDMAEGRVKVSDGVETGDVVVVSGVHQLRDGMEVRIFER